MNLPNRLTVLRVCMVPVFVVFMLWNGLGSSAKYVAAVIFILASMTDWLDGYLARKNNLVTDFGKFMDPIADKLLVCSAMICLVEKGALPAWIVIIIIGREFIISGFRLVASDKLFLALKQAGIYVRYFKKPRIDNYLRITIGTDEEMEELYKFLEHYLAH